MARPRSGKVPHNAIKSLTERHREMARRLVLGERQCEVAKAFSISQPRMSDIERSPVFIEYMQNLSVMREHQTRDVLHDVKKGASTGLDLLLRVLTEGTKENRASSISTRVNVARDLLDREGSAPRQSKRYVGPAEHGVHLTSEDLKRIKLGASQLRRVGRFPR